MSAIIRTVDLKRVYHLQGEDIHAVDGISMEIHKGRMTAIVGRSGSGKTTTLNMISGLDTPTSGEVWVEDKNLYQLSEGERIALRRDKIGFVFQNFGLLPLLSATENVSIPLRMQKMKQKQIDAQVRESLDWVGLGKRASHRPYELSGGEQQRVAIARALVSQPEIILADEPTGQLDSQTGLQVLAIMRRLVEEQGITMVVVTHDPQVRTEADDVYEIAEGRLLTAVG